jgi:hypothetical protein
MASGAAMATRRAAVAARPSAVPHKNPPALRPPVPLPSPAPRPSGFPCAPSPGWTSQPAFCCPRRVPHRQQDTGRGIVTSRTSHRDVPGDDHQTAQLALDIILRRVRSVTVTPGARPNRSMSARFMNTTSRVPWIPFVMLVARRRHPGSLPTTTAQGISRQDQSQIHPSRIAVSDRADSSR